MRRKKKAISDKAPGCGELRASSSDERRNGLEIRDRMDPFALARSIPSFLSEVPLSDLRLTSRCYNVFHRQGIQRLADLKRYSIDEALRWRNFGPKSAQLLAEELDGLRDSRSKRESSRSVGNPVTLIESVTACLEQLPMRERLICRARFGLDQKRSLLRELAKTFHLSPERVRKVEFVRCSYIARDHPWAAEFPARLNRIVDQSRAPVCVEFLEVADPWFAGVGQRPELLRALLCRFARRQFVMSNIDGKLFLTKARIHHPRRYSAGGFCQVS